MVPDSFDFCIHYVVSGKGYVEIQDEVHTLGAGDAVLYFPLQRQHYYSSQDDPWHVRWVHFYGNGIHEYLIHQELNQSHLWSLRQPHLWEQAHEKLLQEAETSRMLHPTRISTLTYALLTLFVEHAYPLNGHRASSSGERIMALLPMMQQEATSPFDLEHWAALAGVSPHYFCKLFRNVMEMTPMDFITRCRLQVAKQSLIEKKTTPIGQIAQDCGYPSVSYFNKRFMEHEGMTPTAYRQLFDS